MSRRPSLPGAAELFRTTAPAESAGEPAPELAAAPAVAEAASGPRPVAPARGSATGRPAPVAVVPDVPAPAPATLTALATGAFAPAQRQPVATRTVRATRRVRADGERVPSGRERHEEKITVYCSPEELHDLESARLLLRAEHGMAVDRGRIVREAIAVVLADLQAKGESSILVRRLRES